MCFLGRGTHITRDMCFLGRGTHITRDMCFLARGTQITRDMCFLGRGTQITRDMFFQGRGTHITRDMFFWGRGTHITRDTFFLGSGTHITREMCFSVNKPCQLHLRYFYLLCGIIFPLRKELSGSGPENTLKIMKNDTQGLIKTNFSFSIFYFETFLNHPFFCFCPTIYSLWKPQSSQK